MSAFFAPGASLAGSRFPEPVPASQNGCAVCEICFKENVLRTLRIRFAVAEMLGNHNGHGQVTGMGKAERKPVNADLGG